MKTLSILVATLVLGSAAQALAQVCPPPPPPPGGGGGGGGTSPPVGGTPPSSPPSIPSPPAPRPSTPTSPAAAPPAALGPGVTPGPAAADPPGPTGVALSRVSIGEADQDLLHWSHWWYLESTRYLDIRAHVQGPAAPDGRTVLLNAPLAPTRNLVRTRVLPRLLRLVSEERSDDIVSAALVAIGRLSDPGELQSKSALVAIRGRLADSNTLVRESALVGLGLLGSSDAATDLIDVLRDTERGRKLVGSMSISSRMRAYTAHALGLAAVRMDELAERQRIALTLIEALESGNHARDDFPVAALGSLGLIDLGSRTVVPAKDLRDRVALDHVISNRALARYLARWVEKPRGSARLSTRVRSHACVAYARVGSTADEDVRTAAVERLVTVASDRGEHVHVRTSATIALGEVARAGSAPADREARRQLLDLARSGQPLERRFARIAVASACARPGAGEDAMAGWEEVRKTLTSELGRSRSSDLAWTALAIGILEGGAHRAGIETGPSATAALTTMARRRRSDDDSAALGLGLALAARGTARAESIGERVVQELDQTTTPVMRGHLAIALGLLDHSSAAETLRDDLKRARNQPILLWSTAVGLGLLGESVGADLVEALKRSTSSAQRIAITSALGQTGTARAVEPLLELLDETQRPTRLRASVVDALGAICDLERLPWRDPIAHAMPYFAATPTLYGDGGGLLERPW